MATHLSKQMRDLLDLMQLSGKPLRRWPGGWWGLIGSPVRQFESYEVPVPDFPTVTVRALAARGLLKRAHVREEWQDDFVLVGG